MFGAVLLPPRIPALRRARRAGTTDVSDDRRPTVPTHTLRALVPRARDTVTLVEARGIRVVVTGQEVGGHSPVQASATIHK